MTMSDKFRSTLKYLEFIIYLTGVFFEGSESGVH